MVIKTPMTGFLQESISCVRVGIEKSVPRDHRLSLLGKPCDAKKNFAITPSHS